jgi:hypothetical protein
MPAIGVLPIARKARSHRVGRGGALQSRWERPLAAIAPASGHAQSRARGVHSPTPRFLWERAMPATL